MVMATPCGASDDAQEKHCECGPGRSALEKADVEQGDAAAALDLGRGTLAPKLRPLCVHENVLGEGNTKGC